MRLEQNDWDAWSHFVDKGLLWWINRQLHLLGWTIAIETDQAGKVTRAVPTLTRYRGFHGGVETDGFKKVTRYMAESVGRLLSEAES